METTVPFNDRDKPRAKRGRQKEISHLAAWTTTRGAQPRVCRPIQHLKKNQHTMIGHAKNEYSGIRGGIYE